MFSDNFGLKLADGQRAKMASWRYHRVAAIVRLYLVNVIVIVLVKVGDRLRAYAQKFKEGKRDVGGREAR